MPVSAAVRLIPRGSDDKLRSQNVLTIVVKPHMSFDLIDEVAIHVPVPVGHDHGIRGDQAILYEHVDRLPHAEPLAKKAPSRWMGQGTGKGHRGSPGDDER